MAVKWVIDYEALNAWSALAAAVGTLAAVVVALSQAGKARAEAIAQQKYRNWLEQKRLEEQHLTKMLHTLNEPFRDAVDFFFSGARLLAAMPANIAPTPMQNREVHEFIESFARRGASYDATINGFINIVGALRELHRSRGNAAEASEYDALLKDVAASLNTTSDLREWLADPDVIRATRVDTFSELPLVDAAREAVNKAERDIARRLVRLYENPPSG